VYDTCGWNCEFLKPKDQYLLIHTAKYWSFSINIYLMKFLIRFNEADEHQMSWAGSIYADKNPIVTKFQTFEPIPLKDTDLFKCQNCGIEMRFFRDEEIRCRRCSSDDLVKELN